MQKKRQSVGISHELLRTLEQFRNIIVAVLGLILQVQP